MLQARKGRQAPRVRKGRQVPQVRVAHPVLQGRKARPARRASRGAQGPAGPQGPSGVIATYSLSGSISGPIAANSSGYVWVGPTATVSVTQGDYLMVTATATLATTAFLGTAEFAHNICYQPAAGGAIQQFVGRSNASVGGLRTAFNSSVRIPLTTGSYRIGYCVYNYSPTVIDNVDEVTGWVMVTH